MVISARQRLKHGTSARITWMSVARQVDGKSKDKRGKNRL